METYNYALDLLTLCLCLVTVHNGDLQLCSSVVDIMSVSGYSTQWRPTTVSSVVDIMSVPDCSTQWRPTTML